MKPYKILLFILGVLAVFCAEWYIAPAGEIHAAGVTLRMPSRQRTLAEMNEVQINVDEVLEELDRSFEIADTLKNVLQTYKDFIMSNPNRMYLPHDDYTFFDDIFARFEQARNEGHTYRIVHYGDSQIELDRLSGILRSRLQELFGGSGTGMFPPHTRVPSPLFVKSVAGDFTHYAIVGDSTTSRIRHGRYGMMTQFSHLSGTGTISVRSKSPFRRISLLMGGNSDGFRATISGDSVSLRETFERDSSGVRYVHWDLPHNVSRMTLRLQGSADIYGVALDSLAGVTVDNVSLRGCSGTIFTLIDKEQMTRMLDLAEVQIIILQFGGNTMPSIRSAEQIPALAKRIADQIEWLHECAPQAAIIFIGPADMGRRRDGRMATWPLLPEWVEALRTTALEHNAAFWDMFSVMGGENSMAQWVNHSPRYAGPDYIHFTTLGAEFMGNALAKSLLTYYDFYRFRQTLTPEEVNHFLDIEKRQLQPLPQPQPQKLPQQLQPHWPQTANRNDANP